MLFLDEVERIIKPYDIIVSRSDTIGPLISIGEWILRGEGAYSHAGIVVNKSILSSIKDDRLWILESNVTSKKFGVQLHPLIEWLKNYKGVVYVSRSKQNITTSLDEFYNQYKNTPYQINPISWICLCIPCIRYDDNKSVICSELVCRVLQHIGLVDLKIDADKILPVDINRLKSKYSYPEIIVNKLK